jgi:hypothetical protein
MDIALLHEIETKINNKKIGSLIKKLENKFSLKSFSDLGNLQELAYWLFTYSEYDLSEKICDMVCNEKYNGDIELWAPVEYIKVLKCRLLLSKNEIEKVDEYRNEIKDVNKNSKGFIRRLNGSLLPKDEIKDALENNNTKSAIAYYFSQIPDLIFMEIMNENKINEKVETELNETIEYIKRNNK